MADALDLQDIQGLIIRGYGALKAAWYILLEINAPQPAKKWLSILVDTLTTGQIRPVETALNIAFTYAAITKLSLAPAIQAMFSKEFIDGMTTPHKRLPLAYLAE